jgi:DNA-binding NtrC family response regulator
MKTKVLLAEDDSAQRQMIARLLEKQLDFDVVQASDGRIALSILDESGPDDIRLVIMDVNMPGMGGLEALEIIRKRHSRLPVIILTASNETDLVVQAMRAGAQDFLSKPPELERLRVSATNALRVSVLEREVTRLKRKEQDACTFENLIGGKSGLVEVVKVARKAAASDIPVLLTGETGVGKEVLARAIHGESQRTGKPFVAVNCGAIPENLVESTLFGHEKGAFTGAIAKAMGRFREAEGGTIFLDEIGELPLDAQVKLLRALQQKEVMPVGGAKALKIDVRIISATNRNLEEEVAANRFRGDLYFRLNVLQIRMPPLRDRRQDIPMLARHFIERCAVAESLPLKDLSSGAVEMLSGQAWPGNIRELENTIHRAMILSEGKMLELGDFQTLSTGAPAPVRAAAAPAPADGAGVIALVDAAGNLKPLIEIEKEALAFSLAHTKNNITRAANALGMSKSTFYRKLQELKDLKKVES